MRTIVVLYLKIMRKVIYECIGNVTFTGRADHDVVREYMYKCKIGIVSLLPEPKYFKNIPIERFEYMSCGIPVI
jgi:glycosyltransferase involved in cell wall biosynthesis